MPEKWWQTLRWDYQQKTEARTIPQTLAAFILIFAFLLLVHELECSLFQLCAHSCMYIDHIPTNCDPHPIVDCIDSWWYHLSPKSIQYVHIPRIKISSFRDTMRALVTLVFRDVFYLTSSIRSHPTVRHLTSLQLFLCWYQLRLLSSQSRCG